MNSLRACIYKLVNTCLFKVNKGVVTIKQLMLANKSSLRLKVKTSVSGLTFTMPVTTVDSKKTCVGLYPVHRIDAKIKITFTVFLTSGKLAVLESRPKTFSTIKERTGGCARCCCSRVGESSTRPHRTRSRPARSASESSTTRGDAGCPQPWPTSWTW